MISQRCTCWMLLLLAATLAFYAILALWKGEPGATVSETCFKLACEHPILVFALGVVVGHIVWPQIVEVPK